jgi:phage shock protein PspC (stress-responsive transcriptional regulator)
VGGVASGLAAYFNTDVVVFRLLFVIFTIFGGLGLISYIVLWIVVPQARTLTDRMQMQGEPVTLANIESKLRQSPTGSEEESVLTRILLFPFRLVGWVITGLGKLINPVAQIIRVALGIVLTLAGLVALVGIFTLFGVLLGLFTLHTGWIPGWEHLSFPVQELARTIPSFTAFTALIFLLIPGIVITLLGISVIAGRIVFNALVGWSLFTLFLVALAVLGFSVPGIIMQFREEGEVKTETVYRMNGKTPVLQTRETGLDDYRVATLSIRGYAEKDVKLVQYFRARGKSRKDAEEYARQIVYTVQQQDSVLTFDSNIQFREGSVFRAQRLRMVLYVPYNQPFVLEGDIWRLLTHYLARENRYGQTWMVTEENTLKCLTCATAIPDEDTVNWEEEDEAVAFGTQENGFENFNAVELNGAYDVTIQQGDAYQVEWTGKDDARDRYKVYQNGRTLVVKYDRDERLWPNLGKTDKVRIRITMPHLERLEANGAGKVNFSGFTANHLEIEVAGAVKLKGDVKVRELQAEVTGASVLTLSGEGHNLEAQMVGASILDAYSFRVNNAHISVTGASKAKVYVTDQLEIEQNMASDVDYRGNPKKVVKLN